MSLENLGHAVRIVFLSGVELKIHCLDVKPFPLDVFIASSFKPLSSISDKVIYLF